MKESVVVIPTYNEIENIEAIIQKVFSLPHPFHVLIVDDNSPDGTAQAVMRLQTEYPDRLFLEQRKGKLGLGTAYIHGFKYALREGYQYIFEMDADFSHNPNDLISLHQACAVEGYDLAIGSRYSSGVNVVNWPMSRVLLSYFASRYVRLVTGMPIHDATAGFKCYSRQVLETIKLDKIRFIGYAFQIEMKFLTYKFGFKIKEVPIIFTDRTKGQSKMSKGIIREAFLGVIQMKLDSYFRYFTR
ncbi:dolichyl-phosphate beta-D-mannosyltransferase [Rufibacter radiotolerans]|uniref:Dolichyl-phosphate beta-D-mannosyltransferase n=1 Tax=Rufibacter radiotolerans TaxID=1379910 RepID=A0A0H4VQQ9_9BACT|nr:polyprenol monophosphomannose synthase [Rufibacter radiotolerans]AKQ46069.1 dolichyl-phosphate beta-D-mannosyltransferase [Rufibacter radiotolerans]